MWRFAMRCSAGCFASIFSGAALCAARRREKLVSPAAARGFDAGDAGRRVETT